MILAILFTIINFQTSCTIVKNNGDEVVMSTLVIHQTNSSTSFDKLSVSHQGKPLVLELKDLKRLNLQESLGKKKGVTTWKALAVKRNDQKMEVKLDLIKISGKTNEGEEMVMNSASIDKISF